MGFSIHSWREDGNSSNDFGPMLCFLPAHGRLEAVGKFFHVNVLCVGGGDANLKKQLVPFAIIAQEPVCLEPNSHLPLAWPGPFR